MKAPLESVTNRWTCWERSWVNSTGAPATMAPAASTTVPLIWPVTPWALAAGNAANNRKQIPAKIFILLTTNLPNGLADDLPLSEFRLKRFKDYGGFRI